MKYPRNCIILNNNNNNNNNKHSKTLKSLIFFQSLRALTPARGSTDVMDEGSLLQTAAECLTVKLETVFGTETVSANMNTYPKQFGKYVQFLAASVFSSYQNLTPVCILPAASHFICGQYLRVWALSPVASQIGQV